MHKIKIGSHFLYRLLQVNISGYYFTEHIRSNGSHFLYIGVTTIYGLYNWLLLTVNILASFIFTLVTTVWLASLVTTYNEHNSFNIWKPLLVHKVLLLYGLYDWLLQTLNIIALTFGSHYLYTWCYYIY